jgi:hypothetical protein
LATLRPLGKAKHHEPANAGVTVPHTCPRTWRTLGASTGCPGRDGIDRRDFYLPVGALLDDDIAREHRTDLVLGL